MNKVTKHLGLYAMIFALLATVMGSTVQAKDEVTYTVKSRFGVYPYFLSKKESPEVVKKELFRIDLPTRKDILGF